MGPPLHTYKHMPCTTFNRLFAIIYMCAIAALIYHHFLTLLRHSTTIISVAITTSLLISDLILGFMWATTTSFRLRPILRQVYPENVEKVLDRKDFPAIDIFICTADPYKEPPMNVVNTAISLMAYDYPPEKISVYVSDDGGSELTLFAFMEAANFVKVWLPFCREYNIMDRCPEAYFGSQSFGRDEVECEEIKAIYESMKVKVENVVERGEVCSEYMTTETQRHIFNKYRIPGFARTNHPPIIQEDTCGVEHVGLLVLRLEICYAVELQVPLITRRKRSRPDSTHWRHSFGVILIFNVYASTITGVDFY